MNDPSHGSPTAPRRDGLASAAAAAAEAAHRFGEAADLYRGLLADRPGDLELHRAVARCAGAAGDVTAALRTIDAAVAIAPDRADLHGDRGQVLQIAGRDGDALAAYRRATALDPAFAPALYGAAQVHERMHRLDDAAEALAAAARVDPGSPYLRLYRATVDRRRGRAGEAQAGLEDLIADQPPDDVCWRAWYELAAVADAESAHDDAMLCLDAAKAVQLRAGAHLRADAEAHWRFFEAGFADVRPADLAAWRSAAPAVAVDGHRHAFLVGFPRSGTTLVEQVLAAHPAVAALDERELVSNTVDAARRLHPSEPTLAHVLRRLAPDELAALRRLYRTEAATLLGRDPGPGVLVDKQPLNLLYVPAISRLYPDGKLIVALRDPRDVVLSCYMQAWGLNRVTVGFTTLADAARVYARVMSAWLARRAAAPLDHVEVRYEDAVADLPGQARRLLALLGVPWDDRVLAFHERARTRYVQTPSYAGVATPVHSRAVGRWRQYRPYLEPVLPTLEPFVRAFGYE